jgi:hypothetical protein
MKRLGLARLVDALAEWGGHETETHDAQPRSSEAMENIDLCLRRRGPLVAGSSLQSRLAACEWNSSRRSNWRCSSRMVARWMSGPTPC